jgi:hypothetical protein
MRRLETINGSMVFLLAILYFKKIKMLTLCFKLINSKSSIYFEAY